jgi:tetratricopeptide (TPR) repeat protein
LLSTALLIGTPHFSSAVAPLDETYKAIQADVRAKNLPDALAKIKQALEDKKLDPKDKARLLDMAGDAVLKQATPYKSAEDYFDNLKFSQQQYEQVKSYYDQILADDAIANSSKIKALNDLANAYIGSLDGQYLDKMDISPANEFVERALKLPNLTPTDQASALSNIGAMYARQARYADAVAAYEKVVALDINDGLKRRAWQAMANIQISQGNADGAIATAKAHGLDLVDIYKKLGQDDAAVAEITKTLDDATVSDAARWATFTKLPYFGWVSSLYPNKIRSNRQALLQLSQKYLPAFLQTDPNRATTFLPLVKAVPALRSDYYNGGYADPELLVWYAPLLLKAPKLSDKDYALVTTRYIDAMAALDVSKAVALAKDAAADPRLNAATQFWALLVNTALSGKNADTGKVIKAEKTLPEKDKAQAVLSAAQTALQAGNEDASRSLYASYEGLFAHSLTATIRSTFVQNAPFDVGSWMNSGLLQNKDITAKMDRPYGDNLEFLNLTDSSTTGRNAAATDKKDSGSTDTNLHTVFDAQGIHLFFDLHDTQAQEVLDGTIGGGSIEMYLAPGENQPYYTFIPNLPDGAIDTGPGYFITMYPNGRWRNPSTDDGTLKTNTHRTKDGFGLSLFLSWDLFYDKLPQNGTKWQFEAIRWTRSGGLSFAGSQSVHNRSSWGDIIFEGMTPEVLTAIKRGIIFDAVAQYKKAKKITQPVGHWADPELGDPAFFEAKVKPLYARLDAYAEKVNKEMTAADTETLFKEAVPDWMEINFRVEALRAQYLMAKLTEK